MHKKIITLSLLCLSALSFAQEKLTLANAINITLSNNYDIKIASLDTIVSKNNATVGNAGLLPKIYVEGGYDYSNNNTDMELLPLDGSTENTFISGDGAITETLNGAVKVEYTLFDGFGGHYRLGKLKSIDGFTQLETKSIIESSVVNTIKLYLNVATEQASTHINEEQLVISNERLKKAETDFKYGATNKTSVLRALVAVKNDSVALRKTLLNYKTAKTQLNSIMGRDLSAEFKVEEDLDFFPLKSRTQLMESLKTNNTTLRMAEQGISIAEFDLKTAKANRMPKLFINGGYSYFKQENELGLLAEQTQDGWNLGLGLRFSIFDGNKTKRNIQNAKINVQQNELRKQHTQLQVYANFSNIYAEYEQALHDLAIEESNLKTFEQSFNRSQIDYRNGQINSTDLRTAQLDLSNAKLRIVSARYLVKQKETELLQITGNMLNLN